MISHPDWTAYQAARFRREDLSHIADVERLANCVEPGGLRKQLGVILVQIGRHLEPAQRPAIPVDIRSTRACDCLACRF